MKILFVIRNIYWTCSTTIVDYKTLHEDPPQNVFIQKYTSFSQYVRQEYVEKLDRLDY